LIRRLTAWAGSRRQDEVTKEGGVGSVGGGGVDSVGGRWIAWVGVAGE
jgi:hypothetical protein